MLHNSADPQLAASILAYHACFAPGTAVTPRGSIKSSDTRTIQRLAIEITDRDRSTDQNGESPT
jgi:hypothetical protein